MGRGRPRGGPAPRRHRAAQRLRRARRKNRGPHERIHLSALARRHHRHRPRLGHASGTPAERIIRDLERAKAPPTLLGFGISTPGHVRRALEAGAAGVIVGSALVKIVSEHLGDRDAMLKALGSAAASFKAATRTA